MKTPRVPFLAAWAAGAALLLGAPQQAGAATLITADGVNCSLANAILTANTNVNTGGCNRVGANSIDDIIELTYDVTISTKDPTAGDDEDEEYGANALPAITCHITLNANGHTIQRDPTLFAPPDGDGIDPCSGPGEKFRILFVDYPGGNLDLNDAVIRNGCVGDTYGGGGILFLGHSMNLKRVLVANNRAGEGGGIFQHESTLNVNDSTLTGNAALAGGGIYTRTGTQKVSNSLLLSNAAIGGSGNVCVDAEGNITCMPKGSGGAIAIHGGSASVTGATIAQGAAVSGGVLYNSGATAYLTNATLFQNSAANGGVLSSAGGTAIITNATAYQNSATGNGGVIYIFGGLAKIVHGTVFDNSAASGGAVFVLTRSRSVTLSDTLLQNSAGGNCALGAPGAGVNSGGHNLSTDNSCLLTGAGDHIVADLGLGTYTDDGTPADGRLPLLPVSPAIDTGAADGTLADQIGEPRIGNPDIGAVEYPRSARVWIGVKGKADYGLRVDLLAEVFVNGAPAGSGLLTNLTTGQPGFAKAVFYTVPLPAVDAPSGATLDLKVSARRSCSGSGINSGIAQLWYNGQPVDSGTGAHAGSRVGVTAAGQTAYLFLRDGPVLDPAAGTLRPFDRRLVDQRDPLHGRRLAPAVHAVRDVDSDRSLTVQRCDEPSSVVARETCRHAGVALPSRVKGSDLLVGPETRPQPRT